MRYAVSNWIYGNEPLRNQFARLEKFGYQGIELVGEPNVDTLAEARRLSQKSNIPISSILGWSIWGIPGRDVASPDKEERNSALRYGKECVNFASELEAPILVVLPAPAGRTAPIGNPNNEAEWQAGYQREWELAVEAIKRLAQYAAKHGVTLGLEPINRYETFLVTNLEQALRFLQDVGESNLKLHLDLFHMNIDEPDIPAAIRQAGNLLVNLHVSDSNREAPGRGHTDFLAIFRALKDINYQGFLTLEPVPPGSEPLLVSRFPSNLRLRDIYAQESIHFLKQLEQQV